MTNIDKTAACKVVGRIMDSLNPDDTKSFHANFTSPQSFYFDDSVGEYNLDNMIVYLDPHLPSNLYLQLKCISILNIVTCSSVMIPIYNTESPYTIKKEYNQNYALYVNVRTFPCQLGEAYNLEQCKACSAAEKTYQVDKNQLQCNSMDSATMQDVTPVAIKLKNGYWRAQFDL